MFIQRTKDFSVPDSDANTTAGIAKAPVFIFEPAQLAALKGTGFELIPLHAPNAIDARGRPIGKAPQKGWRKADALDAAAAAELLEGGINVGVRLNADDLVIDVDPRNFANGDDPLARLESDLKLNLSAFPTVETGSGGKHIYMKVSKGTLVLNSLEGYAGVEFKAQGRQIVAPGSAHPEARKPYRLVSGSFADVPRAPEALVSAILRPVRASVGGGGDYSPEWLSRALELLDPSDFRDHDRWLELMMACHHATSRGIRTGHR